MDLRRPTKMKVPCFDLVMSVIAGLFACLIVFPLLSLFTTTSPVELAAQFRSPLILSAVMISVGTSVTVVLLACGLGLPVAYLLAMKDFKGKQVLDTLVDLPISIPPLVAGLALLTLLGGNSPAGEFMAHHGIEVIFSKKGIIVAQLFVSCPFLIRSAKEAFASIDKNIINASLVLGASPLYTFQKVMLPLAKNGIYAGMIMTWARALGEFGATTMVAGSIPFQTETMTLAVYQNAMSGELNAALAVALLLTVFSFTLLLIFKSRTQR
jgi:molybdate transport system permease protein